MSKIEVGLQTVRPNLTINQREIILQILSNPSLNEVNELIEASTNLGFSLIFDETEKTFVLTQGIDLDGDEVYFNDGETAYDVILEFVKSVEDKIELKSKTKENLIDPLKSPRFFQNSLKSKLNSLIRLNDEEEFIDLIDSHSLIDDKDFKLFLEKLGYKYDSHDKEKYLYDFLYDLHKIDKTEIPELQWSILLRLERMAYSSILPEKIKLFESKWKNSALDKSEVIKEFFQSLIPVNITEENKQHFRNYIIQLMKYLSKTSTNSVFNDPSIKDFINSKKILSVLETGKTNEVFLDEIFNFIKYNDLNNSKKKLEVIAKFLDFNDAASSDFINCISQLKLLSFFKLSEKDTQSLLERIGDKSEFKKVLFELVDKLYNSQLKRSDKKASLLESEMIIFLKWMSDDDKVNENGINVPFNPYFNECLKSIYELDISQTRSLEDLFKLLQLNRFFKTYDDNSDEYKSLQKYKLYNLSYSIISKIINIPSSLAPFPSNLDLDKVKLKNSLSSFKVEGDGQILDLEELYPLKKKQLNSLLGLNNQIDHFINSFIVSGTYKQLVDLFNSSDQTTAIKSQLNVKSLLYSATQPTAWMDIVKAFESLIEETVPPAPDPKKSTIAKALASSFITNILSKAAKRDYILDLVVHDDSYRSVEISLETKKIVRQAYQRRNSGYFETHMLNKIEIDALDLEKQLLIEEKKILDEINTVLSTQQLNDLLKKYYLALGKYNTNIKLKVNDLKIKLEPMIKSVKLDEDIAKEKSIIDKQINNIGIIAGEQNYKASEESNQTIEAMVKKISSSSAQVRTSSAALEKQVLEKSTKYSDSFVEGSEGFPLAISQLRKSYLEINSKLSIKYSSNKADEFFKNRNHLRQYLLIQKNEIGSKLTIPPKSSTDQYIKIAIDSYIILVGNDYDDLTENEHYCLFKSILDVINNSTPNYVSNFPNRNEYLKVGHKILKDNDKAAFEKNTYLNQTINDLKNPLIQPYNKDKPEELKGMKRFVNDRLSSLLNIDKNSRNLRPAVNVITDGVSIVAGVTPIVIVGATTSILIPATIPVFALATGTFLGIKATQSLIHFGRYSLHKHGDSLSSEVEKTKSSLKALPKHILEFHNIISELTNVQTGLKSNVEDLKTLDKINKKYEKQNSNAGITSNIFNLLNKDLNKLVEETQKLLIELAKIKDGEKDGSLKNIQDLIENNYKLMQEKMFKLTNAVKLQLAGNMKFSQKGFNKDLKTVTELNQKYTLKNADS